MISETELFERLNAHFGIADIQELQSKCRKIEYVYARMIYSEYQRRNKIHPKHIAKKLNRDRATILYTLQTFIKEYGANVKFRELVNNIFEE